MSERTKLISYLLYDILNFLFSTILKMNTIENTRSNFQHLPNLRVGGHSGSLSLNRNEPGDTIETTRHSFFDNEKFRT